MRIIIAGGRDFDYFDELVNKVDYLISKLDINNIEIISGGANGADKLGERYAVLRKLKLSIFPADWDKYGKGAGYRRNTEMAEYANSLIAFWDGKSRGTMHMINIAKKKGLQVKIITYTPSIKPSRQHVKGI